MSYSWSVGFKRASIISHTTIFFIVMQSHDRFQQSVNHKQTALHESLNIPCLLLNQIVFFIGNFLLQSFVRLKVSQTSGHILKNFFTWALIHAQLGSNNIIYCATWVVVEMVWSKRILRSKMSDKEKSNSQGDYTVNNVIIYHYCLGSIHLITFIEMIIYYVHAEFWTLSFKWKFKSSSLNLHSLFLYCMR